MDPSLDDIDEEISRLRAQLHLLEEERDRIRKPQRDDHNENTSSFESPLSSIEIERYSRQLLCGAWDTAAQRRLLGSTVLCVGAGGIGSAVLPYLAGAGVGTILVADHDTVDTSNLHRQVLHSTSPSSSYPPKPKAISAQQRLYEINPHVHVEALCWDTGPLVALDQVVPLVERADVVVDASDNPATRYLLNDACRLRQTPLVSASAIQSTAQLTVYDNSVCCYRCLYPPPPPAAAAAASSSTTTATADSCSDVGVLGPVPGVVGTLQAMETLKVLTGYGTPLTHHMLVYDACEATWLRLRKPTTMPRCPLCRGDETLETATMLRGPAAAAAVCSANRCGRPQQHEEEEPVPSISVTDYADLRRDDVTTSQVLIDVRAQVQFDLCHLPEAVSVPLEDWKDVPSPLLVANDDMTYYCICRRGIASREATRRLLALGVRNVVNIREGLDGWRKCVDQNFPKY